MKKQYIANLLLTILMMTAVSVSAQFLPPPGPTPTPTNTPIDGGAVLLVAGGIAYGYKKMRNRKKEINPRD